jgi:diadenosine tetraphosphate (Ap4A) HIT family hydrolase
VSPESPPIPAHRACELCTSDGGRVLLRRRWYRVVLVDDPGYPGFCRLIVDDHVAEMSDLPSERRRELMDAVFVVEEEVRRATGADKMNLASLGNMTPHLHWHVIPRWRDDARFPDPIWGPPRRSAPPRPWSEAATTGLAAALARRLE